MPQGGIDKGEEPGRLRFASWRRKRASRRAWWSGSANARERLNYDLPEELRGKLWGGKWIGQDQDWFLARFLGTDEDVNIATAHRSSANGNGWSRSSFPDLIVPFKRDLYRQLLWEFADIFRFDWTRLSGSAISEARSREARRASPIYSTRNRSSSAGTGKAST